MQLTIITHHILSPHVHPLPLSLSPNLSLKNKIKQENLNTDRSLKKKSKKNSLSLSLSLLFYTFFLLLASIFLKNSTTKGVFEWFLINKILKEFPPL